MSEIPRRIEAKIQRTDTCWLWTGGLNSNGYGRTTRTGTNQTVMVHRYVYEFLVGEIPQGLQLDHLCRVRNCCNPAHLEPVDQRTNLLRGETLSAKAAAVTHCPAGHPYAGANLRISPQGHRYCRQCRREQESARRARLADDYRIKQRVYDAAYRARKADLWASL